MPSREHIQQSFKAALPVVLGYVAIGVPCGILSASIGLNVAQVLIFCLFFYSGAGQFMIPNLWLAGVPIASIIASVSLVNTRQMLYSASLAPFTQKARKRVAFLFAATVTDESYGINIAKFTSGEWSVGRATMVNLFSQLSWTLSCVIGVLLSSLLSVPLALASFAMTAIFICLICMQKLTLANGVAVVVAAVVVIICKLVGLTGPAILIGAIAGALAAFIFVEVRKQ